MLVGSEVYTAAGQVIVAVVVGVFAELGRRKVKEVHVLVNNRSQEQDAKIALQGEKIDELERALVRAHKPGEA